MKLALVKGSTSQTVLIFIQNSSSTTGAGLTALVFNSAGLTAYYARPRAAAVAITLATQTVTGGFSSGGFVEIDATNMPGVYRLDIPDAALASGVDSVVLFLKGATNMAPLPIEIQLTDVNLNDPTPAVNVTEWNGSAVATPTVAGVPEVDVTHYLGAATPALVSGRFDSSTGAMAAGVVTAAAIATGAVDADALATDAVAEIADGVWDEATSGHVASGSFGQHLQPIRAGTAQAGAASTITLDAGASAVTDFYKNALVLITGGTGVSQVRTVSSYDGTTKVATITPNWGTNPDATSVFVIIPMGAIAGASAPTAAEVADAVWDEARSGHTTGGSFGEGVASVQGNVTGSVASVTGAVGSVTGAVGSVGSGGITATSIATGAIDADSLATDAVAEIADGVWDEARAGHVAAGSFGEGVASVQGNVTGSVASVGAGGITAATIADSSIDAATIATDAKSRVLKNTALANFMFLMVDSTDHVTPKTGLTVTPTRSIDGAAFAACANAVVEISNGIYKILLAATDLNGDVITLRFTAATADDRFITIVTQQA